MIEILLIALILSLSYFTKMLERIKEEENKKEKTEVLKWLKYMSI